MEPTRGLALGCERFVVDKYEFFRTPENNLLLNVVSSFEREMIGTVFLKACTRTGFGFSARMARRCI